MGWFTKAKNWIKGWFGKKEVEKPIEVPVATTTVEDPVEEAPAIIHVDTPLAKQVKEARALSPDDLLDEARKVVESKKCEHVHAFTRQVWSRVAEKKFELQNEMICLKCKDLKVVPIK